ncbi:glycosyltransferase family 61 protein [Ramlibacter terrae]|uniref:Glycosyltransferase family 61 protein n=1 Tax=Ramlibacter terrae TaxID=2732511 RepID=A0ABX6P8J6_9BURK|nr:glycosyltransferase family 61 protein [Ramlibacter terrae]
MLPPTAWPAIAACSSSTLSRASTSCSRTCLRARSSHCRTSSSKASPVTATRSRSWSKDAGRRPAPIGRSRPFRCAATRARRSSPRRSPRVHGARRRHGGAVRVVPRCVGAEHRRLPAGSPGRRAGAGGAAHHHGQAEAPLPAPAGARAGVRGDVHLWRHPEPELRALPDRRLARLWYAKAHPDLPIVWHARGPSLSPMQLAILDVLGIANPHLFVHAPSRFARMVFPIPGCSLGTAMLPEHGAFLGAVEPAPVVPGKKTYLSRGKLGSGRGSSEDDTRLEALLRAHGFGIYHPELHSIREQLAAISSSELVLGIEGSALHSPVLLKAPIATRFIAIGRHRMGEGAYEHIRQAKGLDYRTLNLRKTTGSLAASAPLDIDIDLLESLLVATGGFSADHDALAPHTCRPDPSQGSYVDALPLFRTGLTDPEQELARAILLLHRREGPAALDVLLPMFQPLRVVNS